MANDIDPQLRKKIDRFTAKLASKCTPKTVFDFLEPCRKVSITITLSRGLEGFIVETSHRVGGLSSGFVSDNPITTEVWEQILALKPFSEKPDRTKDRELRLVLLTIREEGWVDYYRAYHFHKQINEILANNEMPYRFVKMYISEAHREGYVVKKIE